MVDSSRARPMPRLAIIVLAMLLFVPGLVLVAMPGRVHVQLERVLDAPGMAKSAPPGDDSHAAHEVAEAYYAAYEARANQVERGLIVLAGILYLGVVARWLIAERERGQIRARETTFGMHLRTLLDGVQAVESTSNPDELAPRMEVLAAARRRAEIDWQAGLLSHDDIARLFAVYQAGGWAATQRMTRLYFYELQNQGDQLLAAAHPREQREDAWSDGAPHAEEFFARQPDPVRAPVPTPKPSPPRVPEPEPMPQGWAKEAPPATPEPEPPPAPQSPAEPRPWYLDDAPTLGETQVPAEPKPASTVGRVEYAYPPDEQWDTDDDAEVTEGIIGRPVVRRRTVDVEAPAPRVEHESAGARKTPRNAKSVPPEEARAQKGGEEDVGAHEKPKSAKRVAMEEARAKAEREVSLQPAPDAGEARASRDDDGNPGQQPGADGTAKDKRARKRGRPRRPKQRGGPKERGKTGQAAQKSRDSSAAPRQPDDTTAQEQHPQQMDLGF